MTFKTGHVYIAPAEGPQCPVHGKMREDFPSDQWACAGWDGEGCDYTVRNEDWWTDIGTT